MSWRPTWILATSWWFSHTADYKQQQEPPCHLYVLQRARSRDSINIFATHDTTERAIWPQQANAWMNNDVAVQGYSKFFIQKSAVQPDHTVYAKLTLHSHDVLEILGLSEKELIYILVLPPNTNPNLQPLGTGLFSFRQPIPTRTWPGLLRQTLATTRGQELLQNSFSDTGISQLERTKIRELYRGTDRSRQSDTSSEPHRGTERTCHIDTSGEPHISTERGRYSDTSSEPHRGTERGRYSDTSSEPHRGTERGRYSDTSSEPHRGTERSRYSDTSSEPHRGTERSRYSDTSSEPHRGTKRSRYSDTLSEPHRGTERSRHSDTSSEPHRGTKRSRHSDTSSEPHRGTKRSRHSDTSSEPHRGTERSRHSDT
ncbi:hypothetical protein RRG08_049908 [Elysia crispata]|uniref:Uncharacterized protein n=1 Tax=Elysia crispata TaxID=231223 RepID=A0AAE0Y0Q3_9GAST|nr:hypothetical protein RRG08_049908 [Elysia crispata]